MIFSLWQPIGESSHQLAARASQLLDEKTTHTGTLDPMAEGVLVLLSGNDRFVKEHLSDWKKSYRFSILWGVETDSGDALGLITNFLAKTPSPEALKPALLQTCAAFPKTYSQQIPNFSARRFSGASAYDHAKIGTEIPKKSRNVSLSAISADMTEELDGDAILSTQQHSVRKIEGAFRQEEILQNWKETLSGPEKRIITRHQVTVSSGTYIRQLTQDIAHKIGIPATTWSITRTANGPFTQQDCIELSELSDLG